jgi:hypothetical protein
VTDDTGRNAAEPALASPAAPTAGRRRVERSASLTLTAPPDEVEKVADKVIDVVNRYHGFVVSSNVSSGDSDQARATFDLRIPSPHLADAIRDLSDLAHLRARNQAGQDITAEFSSAEDRLKDSRAERRALLKRLAKAANPTEAAAIRQQLRVVRSQIAAAKGELRSLRGRANYSSVGLEIDADKSASTGGAWTPGDAIHDGLRILETAAAVLLVCLAVALPIGLLAGVGAASGRRLRNRRRENALET